MANPASAQVDQAVAGSDQQFALESLEPPGGETAADAAEPPEEPRSLWRRLRRSRLGVAALLPALLLASVYVASPFSGTASQRVDQPVVPPPPAATSAPAYPGSGR